MIGVRILKGSLFLFLLVIALARLVCSIDCEIPTPKMCSETWGFDCSTGPPETGGDNTFDNCSNGAGGEDDVQEVHINATSILPGDSIRVTCMYDPYTSNDYYHIWYYNGTGWKNLYTEGPTGSTGIVNKTVIFTPDNLIGTHWVRCSIDYSKNDNDDCSDLGIYYDNDDINFTLDAVVSVPVFLSKYNESWFGDFVIYANMSNYSTSTWDINTTIISTTGTEAIVDLADNDADGIYNGTYIISNGEAINKTGKWNIIVEGYNGSMIAQGNTSINIVAVRRGPPVLGYINVSQNADGTWRHYIKSLEYVTSGDYSNLTVKVPIFNLPSISDLSVTGAGVNNVRLVNNTIIFELASASWNYITLTFNTTTDLAVMYLDRYYSSHIGVRAGYNGYMVYNSKQSAYVMPKGTKTKGKIFDYRYIVNGTYYNSTYCAERSDVFTDERNHTQGIDNNYGIGWNESEEWLVVYNTTNVIFNQSSGNSSDWNDNINTTVRRTVTFYSNKSYNKQEYFIKNIDANSHVLPFLFGVEPWLEPGNLTSYGDRGIVPDNSTPLGTGINISGENFSKKWMGVYDNSSFLFVSYIFSDILLDDSFHAYFLDYNPITLTTEAYPISIGGVQSDTKSVWFEKNFGSVSGGDEIYFAYYITNGKGASHDDVSSLINEVYTALIDSVPPPFSTEKTKFNISLTKGWNLISFPLNLTNKTLPKPLESIKGNYSKLFTYDGKWIELKDDDKINETFGYWINMTNDDTLAIEGKEVYPLDYDLKRGWNLVSYDSLNTTLLNESLSEVMQQKNTTLLVLTYKDREWLSYSSNKPIHLNTLKNSTPGYGYWVKVPEDLT